MTFDRRRAWRNALGFVAGCGVFGGFLGWLFDRLATGMVERSPGR